MVDLFVASCHKRKQGMGITSSPQDAPGRCLHSNSYPRARANRWRRSLALRVDLHTMAEVPLLSALTASAGALSLCNTA